MLYGGISDEKKNSSIAGTDSSELFCNVTRKLTVLNARTDTILLELTGTFALKNNSDNELEVIIETAEGKYQKDYVFLNDYTMYVVEDISGAEVDKYHYEINFLPEFGLKVTHDD